MRQRARPRAARAPPGRGVPGAARGGWKGPGVAWRRRRGRGGTFSPSYRGVSPAPSGELVRGEGAAALPPGVRLRGRWKVRGAFKVSLLAWKELGVDRLLRDLLGAGGGGLVFSPCAGEAPSGYRRPFVWPRSARLRCLGWVFPFSFFFEKCPLHSWHGGKSRELQIGLEA